MNNPVEMYRCFMLVICSMLFELCNVLVCNNSYMLLLTVVELVHVILFLLVLVVVCAFCCHSRIYLC